MLLSGGKDSTYVLYQLLAMDLRVLTMTLDNGFISEGAKENIRRVVAETGVDHEFASTPAMNSIFVDSLQRFSNVCNGCFKAIYTLAVNLARRHQIQAIVTGLSRGQFFETRLAEIYRNRVFDNRLIDQTILEARKAYHRMDDAVSQLMEVEVFRNDAVFEEIQFVDFYRYCDVQLDEMMEFLNGKVPWIRPADTGRSTNCLINQVGIFVHQRERGFHNYALPYSWDVRLGHKQRQAAMDELDDEIDLREVQKILRQIDYPEEAWEIGESRQRLVAYYTADEDPGSSALREALMQRVTVHEVPAVFVRLDRFPLTPNGKIDRAALPAPEDDSFESGIERVLPRDAIEERLAEIWREVLRRKEVGVHDNFIELGGDSILNIQIVARARRAGLQLTAKQIFDHPTIAELAAVVGSGKQITAEQGLVSGPVSLTPIMRWFFELNLV